MRGCVRNFLASVGCLTLLVLGGVFSWHYRAQLSGLYRSLLRGEPRSNPVSETAGTATASPGRPSPQALRAARRKEELMARADGPGYVVLTASEMAALITDGLAPSAREALDSVEVVLLDDRFVFRAQLLVSVMEGSLGPLAGMFDRREPLTLAGSARVKSPGIVAWEPDSFVVRAFPFPRPAIPALVNRLTGGSDGEVLISVPRTVGDLKIRPEGVTFYRRVEH
ncbi:MAG: hypothetical protein KatS3mg081_0821 [Gemmatimonadales bacterium]|nr:MAG: hypothetical protein KatS3mg081_0821 [Gemmatimonadales bacterium]